ncbi:MAG TPA: glycosyltransferase family 4 protein, partial [Miltoncostaeaceae bacterium]|nr:glycosyltransferase family 4 protein [Miltoncostaeaceae bacterium]
RQDQPGRLPGGRGGGGGGIGSRWGGCGVRAAAPAIVLGLVGPISSARLYLSSRVAVCPLRSGAGTKFKLVEAMAFGMPVVVTKHSAAALSLENGVNGFITDDPREYAEAVVRLIADPALAESFSRAVASTFAREHSTAAIGAELDVVLGAADA